MFQEGQTATHKDGRKIVFKDGAWHVVPPDASALAATNQAQGKGGPSADTRARLALGLDAAVEAQKNLYATEKWNQPGAPSPRGINPLNGVRGSLADMLDGENNNAGWLAKSIGGQDYQNYNQAAKSYESALLPIMSGAAVTPSEATRLIRADLPERGDSPATLARKAKNRALRLNGAATLGGLPPVFPRIESITRAGKPKPPSTASAEPADPLGIR